MIDTSDFLTASECTKFVYGRGSAKDPLPLGGGTYSAPLDAVAGLGRTLLLMGRGGDRRRGEGAVRERGRPPNANGRTVVSFKRLAN